MEIQKFRAVAQQAVVISTSNLLTTTLTLTHNKKNMIWLWREFKMLNQINVLNLLKMLKKPTNVDFGNGAGHKVIKATNAHGQQTLADRWPGGRGLHV